MLNHAFKRNLQLSERDSLAAQIYILLGAAEATEEGMLLPPELAEPRFGVVNSGLYGWVLDQDGKLLWRSQSMELVSQHIIPKIEHEFLSGQSKFMEVKFGEEGYYAQFLDTVWDVNDSEVGYRFVVAHSELNVAHALSRYRYRLFKWLGGLAFLLIIVQTLIARWGLLPLSQLAEELKRIEDGSHQQLQGEYPADIRPVTENLNSVLRSEQAQRERYRNNLSDLAHSLKTPLSVVRGELERNSSKAREEWVPLIEDQIDRMTTIIEHQLRRASAQVTQAAVHAPINLREIIVRINSALQKVYLHKNLNFKLDIAPDIVVAVEEPDMMELLGNFIENACKYGESFVKISAYYSGDDVVIDIEDDGPGVPNAIRKSILERGARADTAKSGQGLGLALSVDILSSYGGGLEIVSSSLGGAKFQLRLPKQ